MRSPAALLLAAASSPLNPPAASSSSSRTMSVPLQPPLFCPFAHFSLRFLFPVSPSPPVPAPSPSCLRTPLPSRPAFSPAPAPPVLPYIPSNPPPGLLQPACCLLPATGLILRAEPDDRLHCVPPCPPAPREPRGSGAVPRRGPGPTPPHPGRSLAHSPGAALSASSLQVTSRHRRGASAAPSPTAAAHGAPVPGAVRCAARRALRPPRSGPAASPLPPPRPASARRGWARHRTVNPGGSAPPPAPGRPGPAPPGRGASARLGGAHPAPPVQPGTYAPLGASSCRAGHTDGRSSTCSDKAGGEGRRQGEA